MSKLTLKQILLPILLSMVAIQGCAVFPGSHIGRFDKTLEKTKTQKDDALKDVNLIEITPALLAQTPQKDTQAIAQAATQHTQDLSNYLYLIAPHDVLTITVWEHPELTIPAGSFRSADEQGNQVKADGTIYFPYAGKLKVAGLSVSQARELLSKKLSRVIENPQVDVRVSKFIGKRYYVTGAVEQAGVFPIRETAVTLLDAIGLAGGLSPNADWTEVILSRKGSTSTLSLADLYQHADLSNNILLKHGDTIHVSRDDFLKVFVLGEVNSPSSVRISRNGISLAEAISDAGGLNEGTSNPTGIFVLRQPPEGSTKPVVYQLNARSATAFIMAEQFALNKRDIIYVTAAPIARWNRIISQLLPTVYGLTF